MLERDDPNLGARRAPGLRKRLYVSEGKRQPVCVQCGGHHDRRDPCPLDDWEPEVPLAPVCPRCGFRCGGPCEVQFYPAEEGEDGYEFMLRLGIFNPEGARRLKFSWKQQHVRNWKRLSKKTQERRLA